MKRTFLAVQLLKPQSNRNLNNNNNNNQSKGHNSQEHCITNGDEQR